MKLLDLRDLSKLNELREQLSALSQKKVDSFKQSHLAEHEIPSGSQFVTDPTEAEAVVVSRTTLTPLFFVFERHAVAA